MSKSELFGKNFLAEILGEPLKNYVDMVGKNPSINQFLCQNTIDCPEGGDPNGISPSLTNFLISAAAAFNYIEKPNIRKHANYSEIKKAVDDVIEDLHKKERKFPARDTKYDDYTLIPYLNELSLPQLYDGDLPEDKIYVITFIHVLAQYSRQSLQIVIKENKYDLPSFKIIAEETNYYNPLHNLTIFYSSLLFNVDSYILAKLAPTVYNKYDTLKLSQADDNIINEHIKYFEHYPNYKIDEMKKYIAGKQGVTPTSTDIGAYINQVYIYVTKFLEKKGKNQELSKTFINALNNLKIVYPRFKYVKELIDSENEYKKYLDEIKNIVIHYPVTDKNNLIDSYIYDFFANYVLKDQKFYSQFFNIVDTESNKVITLYNAGVTKLEHIRLNVKYLKNYVPEQTGGKTEIPIVLDDYIPELGSATGIYIDGKFIKLNDKDALKDMVDIIYATNNAKDSTISLFDTSVIIKTVIDAFLATYKENKWEDIIKSKLGNLLKNKSEANCSTFKDDESKMREFMLKQKSKWVRDDDNQFYFVRYENGKAVDEQLTSMCVYINKSASECSNFFATCALSNDEEFPTACDEIINNRDFLVNIAPNKIAEEIVKMNPIFAFSILKRFNFGFSKETGSDPFVGFNRYRVESVGNWIKDMQNDEINKVFGKNAKDIIARICKNNNLLNYLSILVDWVNANPQVLNPEEGTIPSFSVSYPNTDKSFNLYGYVNPYKTINRRLLDLTSCFARLKSSIGNRMLGHDGNAILNNISMNRADIRMPYNREAFLYAVPYETLGVTLKTNLSGGFSDPYSPLNSNSSYEYFFDIYKMLLETMEQIQNSKIRLSDKSRTKINEKLNELKVLEDQIYAKLKILTEQNALYRASYGYINAYEIPAANMPAIIQKHSNLLGLTSRYNRKAINLIDILNTISNALLTKYGDSLVSTESKYRRPLSASYPEYSATSY